MDSLGLRARLVFLVFLALTPAFGLLLWFWIETSELRTSETEQRVVARAQFLAEAQASRDEGAHQLLAARVRTPGVQALETPACSAYLRAVLQEHPSVYADLDVVNPEGVITCSSNDSFIGLRIGDREFFERTVETRAFTVSELFTGRRSNRPMVDYALPLIDGTALRGVAVATLNLDWLQASLGRVPIGQASGVAILDRNGSVIARQPDAAWLPDRLDSDLLARVRDVGTTHVTREGPDGVWRHYALVWVDSRRDMLALAGLSEDIALVGASRELLTALFVLLAAALLASGVALMMAERQIRRPVIRLLETARQMETGDLGVRASITEGAPEVRRLSAAIDRMAATLQDRERRARESQRLEAIGQLAGGLAHDLNNMLTVILGFSHGLESEVKTPAGRENLVEVIGAAERASNLTSQLLAFARRQVLQARPMQLNDTIRETGSMLRQVIGSDVTMVTLLAPDLSAVRADPSQMEQVILNLVLNARDAMPHGGTVRVETRNLTIVEGEAVALAPVGHPSVPPGDYVLLSVADTGHGMEPDVRAPIFEPFFTTKGSRGTGLGLATVYGITSQNGGFIACESAVGRGTTFSILLPQVHDAVVEAPAGPLPQRAHAPASESLLIVEDEPSVRTLTERVLRSAGYTVVTADGAASAMEIVRNGFRPDLVLTDVVMPHMKGVTLADNIRLMVPGVNVAYMSGHVDHAVLRAANISPKAFLKKPFTPDKLLRAVRLIIESGSGAPTHSGSSPPAGSA